MPNSGDDHICVKCDRHIVGEREKMIQYHTHIGWMHHNCGKMLSHKQRHGHGYLLTEVEKIEEERALSIGVSSPVS